MRTCVAALAVFVFWMVLARAAEAQNARITGAVKDSSGATIPGATARNVDTGLTRVGTTDGAGEFRLPSLPPGRYALTAGRPLFGWSTTLLPNINAPSRQAEFAVRWPF